VLFPAETLMNQKYTRKTPAIMVQVARRAKAGVCLVLVSKKSWRPNKRTMRATTKINIYASIY
jgi:hypothetical protein